MGAECSAEWGPEGTTGDERREDAREGADQQRRPEPEEAEHERQGTDSTWESAGMPRLGKPHGAVRCGAAERETRVEGSISYGEGEHQPAKTERKARGRTEQRIAGQEREAEVERSTSDGEGDYQPAHTDRKARG